MRVNVKTVNEYINHDSKRTIDLQNLDKLIQQATGLKPQMFDSKSYSGVAYQIFPYKYASGREGIWPLISFAAQKNYISLYVIATRDNQYLAELYGKKLGKVSCGKSCIRFKRYEDLDEENLSILLKEAKNLYIKNDHWKVK